MKLFDYSKYYNFKWDNEIISLLVQIHESKARQELFLKQKAVALDKLVEIAKIQSVETSNKIEGIVTTSTRMKQLLSEKTTPQNRDEEEILGYRDVLNTIHENYDYVPVNSNYILQLHRDLYKYSGKRIGGEYKKSQNYISETLQSGEVITRFVPLDAYETPEAIQSICDNFNTEINKAEIDELLLITIFIHDFLCIHPFTDGNGRMSRLLTTLLLYRSGYVVGKYISLESKIEKNKSNYYTALAKSGKDWYESKEDVTPFIKYILGIIVAAYKDFEHRINYVNEKISAFEQVKNAFDNNIGKINKQKIIEYCPEISVKSIERALKILLEQEYIIKHGQGRATFYTKGDF